MSYYENSVLEMIKDFLWKI